MRYSRISNYPKRVVLSDPINIMSIANPKAIGVETIRIHSGYSLEKEFTEFICMNDSMQFTHTII